MMRFMTLITAAFLCAAQAHATPAPKKNAGSPVSTVWIDEMTWQELRDRMQQGTATVIVPTGGTEQAGPHLAMGKHNRIVAATAEMIAKDLGNTVVAPVMEYVPQGRINPPEGHMRFPGTISLEPDTFKAVLEETAKSFKQHGFKNILFIGDSKGNQQPQADVAEELSDDWKDEGVTVLNVSDYYGNNGQEKWLREHKVNVLEPEAHGGFLDAAELMASAPSYVRKDKFAAFTPETVAETGAVGDPTLATPELGKEMLRLKADAALKQIRAAIPTLAAK